jgi:hypothetical protein
MPLDWFPGPDDGDSKNRIHRVLLALIRCSAIDRSDAPVTTEQLQEAAGLATTHETYGACVTLTVMGLVRVQLDPKGVQAVERTLWLPTDAALAAYELFEPREGCVVA